MAGKSILSQGTRRSSRIAKSATKSSARVSKAPRRAKNTTSNDPPRRSSRLHQLTAISAQPVDQPTGENAPESSEYNREAQAQQNGSDGAAEEQHSFSTSYGNDIENLVTTLRQSASVLDIQIPNNVAAMIDANVLKQRLDGFHDIYDRIHRSEDKAAQEAARDVMVEHIGIVLDLASLWRNIQRVAVGNRIYLGNPNDAQGNPVLTQAQISQLAISA